MNKLVAFFFLFVSSIAAAKHSMTLKEIAEHIKHHPATVEREKAVSDLKKAGITAVGTIIGGVLYAVVKNWYEAPRVVTTPLGSGNYNMDCVSESLPTWVTIPWIIAGVGAACYAGIKGRQGAKHLLAPDHKLDVQK